MFPPDPSTGVPDAADVAPEPATIVATAVRRLRAQTLDDVSDARLTDDFASLQRATHELELERLRRLAEIERRGIAARDGHLSAGSWLSSRFRMSWGDAKRDASVARSLEDMPSTRRALEDGEVSMSAARVLARIRQVDPEAFRDDEAQLVDAARIHAMGDLHRIASYWRQQAERSRLADGEDAARSRRTLRASVTFMGMVRLDGDLDPRPARRCCPRSGPSSTPKRGDAIPTIDARPGSVAPTRSPRSAGSGSTAPTDR